MVVPLRDATRVRCGGKAASLAALVREGLPVPDGFVVPFDGLDHRDHEAVARALDGLGDPIVAVRSSAANEDTPRASAAGQYVSVLGVRGAADVGAAIASCQAAARSARVSD